MAAVVWAEAVEGLNTLIDYRYQQHFFAKNGQPGMGSQKHRQVGRGYRAEGAAGHRDHRRGRGNRDRRPDRVPGQRVLLAKGGNGGWGNLQFKSSTNRAPNRANPGQEGWSARSGCG
jgi:GTP-binding protein